MSLFLVGIASFTFGLFVGGFAVLFLSLIMSGRSNRYMKYDTNKGSQSLAVEELPSIKKRPEGK